MTRLRRSPLAGSAVDLAEVSCFRGFDPEWSSTAAGGVRRASRAARLSTPEDSQVKKIGNRPDWQRLGALELLFVVGIAVTRWVSRFGWGFKLNKGARGLPGSLEGDVGPADPRRCELGNDNELIRRNTGQQSLKKALKCRRKRLLKVGRFRPAELADAPRVINDQLDRHHVTLAEIWRGTRSIRCCNASKMQASTGETPQGLGGASDGGRPSPRF